MSGGYAGEGRADFSADFLRSASASATSRWCWAKSAVKRVSPAAP